MAALRELGEPLAAIVPEPNTWRELLHLLDEKSDRLPLKGRSVVQEYGVSSPELLAGLDRAWLPRFSRFASTNGARQKTSLHSQVIHAITRSEIDVLPVTAAVQVRTCFRSLKR